MNPKLITACCLLLFALAAPAAPPGVMRTNLTLQTDYPVNVSQTNTWLKVYSSTNLSLALTNWPVVALVRATNQVIALPINAAEGQRFYAMTVSNWWGETSFSNVAQTPPVPSDSTLSIGP